MRLGRRDALAREFRRRGPWVTRFTVDGRTYGGDFDAARDARVTAFAEAFPGARRVLELGSLEGGHSFALAALPGMEEVVAVEGREANLARARFAQGVLDARGVTFVHADLEHTDLRSLGSFDAVYCVGLLYHQPNPWDQLGRMAAVSDGVFLWTHYAAAEALRAGGYPGVAYREFGLADPLSGLSEASFWPTRDALLAMLRDAGLRDVAVLEDDPEHPHGPGITLTARRPASGTAATPG
jgi:SAM-dependent methyltransferase